MSWGRLTSSLYSVVSLFRPQVVDSPFSKLTDLMLEVVEQQKLPVPRTLLKVRSTCGSQYGRYSVPAS